MDDSERRRAKRSRFDQTEPEPRRASRFDRRSRSPPAKKSESGRDRSPFSRTRDSSTPDVKSPVDPAAAAAAAAAKINAHLQARKSVQLVDVPPVRSGSVGLKDGSTPANNINGEIYISDGDYIKDIEVNDLRNRYILMKGSTQKMIKDETGADVTSRGSYYPDKTLATPAHPPLYLHVTSTTKEGLQKAVAKIEEMMKQELPQLVDERRFRRRDQEQVERDEFGRRKWPEEKIPIKLESLPGFNLRAQVVGHGGTYVKHIQQETGCRVQIKGRGSGYLEASTGRESDEDMFLHVAGPDPKMVEKAKELCEDLLANVKDQYEQFKSRPPRNFDRVGGYSDRPGSYSDRSGYGEHSGRDSANSYHSYNNGGHGYSDSHGASVSASPPPGPPTTTAANAAANATTPDYAIHYAQYYNGADPYAAYGGYDAYMQMYQQWYAAQGAGQQIAAQGASQQIAAVPAPPGSSTPPPPPSDAAPPPPPLAPPSYTSAGTAGYSFIRRT